MLAARRAPLALGKRRYATQARTRPARTALFITAALSGGALLGLYADAKSCPPPPFELAERTLQVDTPLPQLLRGYLVYSLISCDTLVDHAPDMLDALLKVPLVGSLVETVVRHTFFAHFVGGDTARAAFPLVSALRRQNKGTLLVYSVEVDAREAAGGAHSSPRAEPVHKRIVEQTIQSLDVATEFEAAFGTRDAVDGRTWVAVKLTALLPNAGALRNLSLHLTQTRRQPSPAVPFPGTPETSDLAVLSGRVPEGSPLTEQDVRDLKELYDDLNKMCAHAKERGVRILLDAEHSWYQPAIDAFGHALMERFNKLPDQRPSLGWVSKARNTQADAPQPVVYVTYQAYLQRTPAHLAHSLALARQRHYALGVKLVRGAYHPHELAAHASPPNSIGISPDPVPPVHPTKPDTDACFDTCATMLVSAIAKDVHAHRAPHLGVLFGTHNWASCEAVVRALVQHGLARARAGGAVVVPDAVAAQVTFGQLYGMSDSLSDYLVGRIESRTPCVLKYLPYGALAEVMPYISRRAVENKSMLSGGGAGRERKEAARLIWTRLFGGIGL